jgi:hypothetical protein
LKKRNLPEDLLANITRYLKFNIEMKKAIKIEEDEVMNIINDELKGKITTYLNGQILESVHVFSEFPIEFLSNLTFAFKKKTFVFDEYLF